MIHRCYSCEKEMSRSDVIIGAMIMDYLSGHLGMEGWVHCNGSDEEFFDAKRDKEIIATIKKIYKDRGSENINYDGIAGDYDHGIIVCVECSTESFVHEVIEGEQR